MKALGLLLGAGMLALSAGQADATVTVTLSETGYASETFDLGSGGSIIDPTTKTSPVTFGDFVVTASGFGFAPASPNLFTNTLSVSAAKAATLTVTFLQSGLTDLTSDLRSTFTANGTGLDSVTESTTLNGVQLASRVFGATNLGATLTDTNNTRISGPYTDGSSFVIKTSGAGVANSTINLQSAVPEPASWAMMLAGFGFMGFALRQRRRPNVRFA